MNENDRALIALHAWEQGQEVPGGLACADELRAARLDYSLASLARIDALLDALRAQQPPPESLFLQSQGSANLLWLLGCYAGELLGRVLDVPAQWSGCADDLPFRARAASRFLPLTGPPFEPLRAICARLFEGAGIGLQAAFEAFLARHAPSRPRPAADTPLPPAATPDWPADWAGKRPALGEAEIARLLLQPPPWMSAVEQGLAPLFERHAQLLRRGRVVWGALIAPHNALDGAAYRSGLCLQVVYDPAGRLTPEALEALADRLYNEVLPSDDAVQFIYAEHPRLGLAVPAEVSPWPLWMTGTYVAQSHLPDGLLSLVCLPLLIDPERPDVVAVLPAAHWPDRLRERWLAAGESRHGRRHDPEALRRQRIAELRDPAEQQALAQDMHYQMGLHHFEGMGGAPNFERARQHWETACRHGDHAPAMVGLGLIHERGLGAPIDVARARRCFQAAADLGNPAGNHELARSYATEGRHDMAEVHLRAAAAAGFAPAIEGLRRSGMAPSLPPDGVDAAGKPVLLYAGLGCALLAALLHVTGLSSGIVLMGLVLVAVVLIKLHLGRRPRE